MAVLGTALALHLRREGECCLKGSACASRQAVGAWGCLAELLGKGLRGVCIEATGFGWLFLAAVPKSRRNRPHAGHQPRAGSVGSPSVQPWLL